VDAATVFCADKLNAEPEACDWVKILEEAFAHAEAEVEKKSAEDGQPLSEYDTTLDVVLYDGRRLAYGHCGDGGIVGLTTAGEYLKITAPQKDEMFVVPLRNGSLEKNNTWVFGCVEDELASVLLATDGVYDIFFPYLLKGQPVEVYVRLARWFMDNNGLRMSDKNIAKIAADREAFINNEKSITDDKTLLVLINDEILPARKNASYYAEPDWKALKLEWDKKAYPHLFETKKEEEEANPGDDV